jgi:hypothetical protein
VFFRTDQVCPDCNAEIMVYPCSIKMGKVNARSLPGWKRCECKPKFNEISSAEFDALVPGWRELLVPVDPLDPDCSLEEALEDVKEISESLTDSVI